MIAVLLLGAAMFDAWGEPPKDVLENAPHGVSLLAPAKVDLASHSTLPVIIRRRASVVEAAKAPLERFAVAVAVDLKRDRVYAARAVASEDDAPPFEPPDEHGLRDGETTQIAQAELRASLKLPWHAARLQLWALAGGMLSKPIQVELTGNDPVVEAAPSEAPLAPALQGAHPPAHPGVELHAHGNSLRGALRVHGTASSALVHLVFVFQDDGFVSQRDFRVTLHGGAGGFQLGPRELTGINPGRPLRVWAFVHETASPPALFTVQ